MMSYLSCYISNPETSLTTSTEHPFGLLYNPETYKIALVLRRGRIGNISCSYLLRISPHEYVSWAHDTLSLLSQSLQAIAQNCSYMQFPYNVFIVYNGFASKATPP